METKKWYDSETIINALKALAAQIPLLIGSIIALLLIIKPGSVTAEEADLLKEHLPAVLVALGVLVGSGYSTVKTISTIIGRFKAKAMIE